METKAILRQVNLANKKLAELKGVASTMPNEEILIQTLTLQEARESSSIENIVTTQDDLYRAGLRFPDEMVSPATKEVMRYGAAMRRGFSAVRRHKLLTNNIIKEIQCELEDNRAGFRSTMGTVLKNQYGETIYTPPQDSEEVVRLMSNLERYVNEPELHDVDPLIKLAIIHFQFESIHPFYDGNGRTGRIMSILYLVINDLLDLPILYLSRFITRNKAAYYEYIQAIRDTGGSPDAWEQWILYILRGIETTADETIELVRKMAALMREFKDILRSKAAKIYSPDLLNNLFYSPYTKTEHLARQLGISRPTAVKYLEEMTTLGLLKKEKIWRSNYYINTSLVAILARVEPDSVDSMELIRTVNQESR